MMKKGKVLSPKLLPVREIANMLGVHENTVRRWTDSGALPSYRIGTRGDRRVSTEDLEVYLWGHKQKA